MPPNDVINKKNMSGATTNGGQKSDAYDIDEHLKFELFQVLAALKGEPFDKKQAVMLLHEKRVSPSVVTRALNWMVDPVSPGARPWLRINDDGQYEFTELGKESKRGAEFLVGRFDQLTAAAMQCDPKEVNVLRFGCGQEDAVGFVLRAIKQFQIKYSEYRVRCATPRGSDRIAMVARRELDLACVSHASPRIEQTEFAGVTSEPLLTEGFVLVVAEESHWHEQFKKEFGEGQEIGAEKLKELGLIVDYSIEESGATTPTGTQKPFPLIAPDRYAGVRRLIERELEQKFLRLNPSIEIGGWLAIAKYAAEGFGVGLVAESVLGHDLRLAYRRLDATSFPTFTTDLIYRGTKKFPDLKEEQHAFRRALVESAKAFQTAKG